MAKFPGVGEVGMTARGTSIQCVEIVYSDAAGAYTIPVQAGTLVLRGGVVVLTAFDGTGVSLKVGDGTDDDGFIDNTDIDLTTAETDGTPAVKLFSASSNPYAAGKLYNVDDTIDFTFAPGTSATAGKLFAFVEFVNVKLFGLSV